MNKWTDKLDDFNKLLESMKDIAAENNLQLNPDGERVEKVVGLMTNHLVNTGKRICPCKQSHPVNVETDVVCPCPTWKEEIAETNSCFCKLFFKKS